MAAVFDPEVLKQALKGANADINILNDAVENLGKTLQRSLLDASTKSLDKISSFPKSIVNGFSSVSNSILKAISSPFRVAEKYLQSTWLGRSPSVIGLAIVAGLTAVSPFVYRALTTPFTRGEPVIVTSIRNIKDVFVSLGTEIFKIFSDAFKSIFDLSQKVFSKLEIPTSFNETLTKIIKSFNDIDEAATSIRQTLGFFPKEGKVFEENVRQLVLDLADFNVTASQAKETTEAIAKNFTVLQAVDRDLLTVLQLVNVQFGISAKVSADFLKTMGGISGTSAKAQMEMFAFAKQISNANSVGLDDVMKDVSDASNEARIYAGRNAYELVRAAAEARKMGTTLSNMASTAKGLLSFESSITSELKASALLGRNINFNYARQLAFNKDIIGANKEILRITKDIRFNDQNPVFQEAFAAAAGKTVKELQDMLNAEENLNEALASNNKQVREAAEFAKIQEEKKAEISKKEYQENLIREKNLTRIKQLQGEINKLFYELVGDVLEQIGPVLETFIAYLRENRIQIKALILQAGQLYVAFKSLQILSIIPIIFGNLVKYSGAVVNLFINLISYIPKGIGLIGRSVSFVSNLMIGLLNAVRGLSFFIGRLSFVPFASTIATVIRYITSIGTVGFQVFGFLGKTWNFIFTGIGKSISAIGFLFGRIVGGVGSVFIGIGKISGFIFGTFAKFLGPIGFVITAIQSIVAFMRGFNAASGTIGQKIGAGLKNVFYEVIVEPIKMVLNFLKKLPDYVADVINYLATIDMSGIFKDIADTILDALEKIPDFVQSLFTGGGAGKSINWKGHFTELGESLVEVLEFMLVKLPYVVLKVTTQVIDILLKELFGIDLSVIFKNLLQSITSVFNKIYTVGLNTFKVLLSQIVNYFTGGFFSLFNKIGSYFGIDLSNLIIKGLTSSGPSILNALTWAFDAAWESIKWWLGFSPSKLGLLIVEGIKSVGEMLYNNLIKPFMDAKSSIGELITNIADAFKSKFLEAFEAVKIGLESVWEKIKGIGSYIMDVVGKGIKFVSKIVGGGETELKSSAETKTKSQSSDLIVDAIINSNRMVAEKIDRLTNLMSSGQIAINIDGQRANYLLASSAQKFGSLGQATT